MRHGEPKHRKVARMPAYFRPLTGSRLYAQSLGSESAPYIVAAMFTEDMKGHADRLKSSLEKIDLNFVLYQVPMVHCSINARGTTDITFCKPNFIQHVQNAYQAPVLYVDVDIIFREPPLKILQAIHVRPVIDHPEFPAAADNPMRSFQSVTGRRRFKLESVKRRLSLGPFPRDCLIDTSTKCLLRLDPGGRVHVVGRFTIDLWIEPGN
jgi:hypothetical protein